MEKITSKSCLWILPAIFLFLGYNFSRCTYGFDPEYAYLMNGLLIANGDYVRHVDNPGTTVQIFSSLIIRVMHPKGFNGDKTTEVLENPDYFIEAGRKMLVIINSILLLIMGLVTFHFTRNILLAMILQASIFLSGTLLEQSWARFSPEPMLVIATGLMSITLLLYHFSGPDNRKHFHILFGMVSGFGLATKATFLPLALIPLIILRGYPSLKIYIKSMLISFLVITIPAIPSYPKMLEWFYKLFIKTGVYGKGETGIIDPANYLNDIMLVLKNHIIIVATIVSAMVVILIAILTNSSKRNLRKNDIFRTMVALSLAQVAGVLMVAKHYHADHYLLPIIAISGVLTVFIVLYVLDIVKSKLIRIAFPASILLLIIVFSMQNKQYLINAKKGYIETNIETEKFEKLLETDFSDHTLIHHIDRINRFSALKWGNAWSGGKYSSDLSDMHPDGLFFKKNQWKFENWKEATDLKNIISKYGKRIVLVDGQMTDPEIAQIKEKGIFLNTRYKGRVHSLHEIDTTASIQLFTENIKPVWQLVFDPDSISSDGQYFVCGNHSIKNDWHYTKEEAFSGLASVKLSGDNNFGFHFPLDDVQSGQEYQITVWKKGIDANPILVASSIVSDEFWQGSNEVVATATGGWKKIKLSFTVPDIISQSIIVYVWNNSDKTVYLDDFTVIRLR